MAGIGATATVESVAVRVGEDAKLRQNVADRSALETDYCPLDRVEGRPRGLFLGAEGSQSLRLGLGAAAASPHGIYPIGGVGEVIAPGLPLTLPED